MILGKMHKKMEYNYCLMNKFLGALFSGLLFCGILQAESSLPGCQGSNFPTWTNCYGVEGLFQYPVTFIQENGKSANITDKGQLNIQMEQNM